MKKEPFFEKKAPTVSPPYSVPFLSAFHQNKKLCIIFAKGGSV